MIETSIARAIGLLGLAFSLAVIAVFAVGGALAGVRWSFDFAMFVAPAAVAAILLLSGDRFRRSNQLIVAQACYLSCALAGFGTIWPLGFI